ncbi:QsdR family transcriptional regulator [Amycolatopsis methanolica]|uniref:TetR family transcriptional regulator n=1 Tax=Amycolatopsis methanolica 239 TaxID=1068978 RepID=A0A076MS73_AMYME|nr:QsdR family transcriptional regulator [Amycolatopsis methanolica]AIJ21816.1 TetR family transcriptional regulator [Amycolatopsis methanolica 239]
MSTDVSWSRLASDAAVESARREPFTRLSRELYAGHESRHAGPRQALRAARRTFLAGERVDMGALAAELGVDRATLFRWVGNRDELLSEVIWSLCLPTWQGAVRGAEGTGVARVVSVFHAFSGAIIDAGFFRAYLRRERDRALRLLTTRAGVHQTRVIALFEGLLQAEEADSGLRLPLPVRDTAYVMTRIAESFIYADLIVGEEPDAAKAAAAVAALLGPARS